MSWILYGMADSVMIWRDAGVMALAGAIIALLNLYASLIGED